ncbi:transcription termination factor, mitochondrial-like [Babylonia areolata]|uniref:transcription termination factor, mitochondrial-like n=1 Tax=Babylonia areolata TaxID=304850 RepID=UPI003FD11621
MALRKFAPPLASLVISGMSPWRLCTRVGPTTSFVPQAKVWVNIKPHQHYSRRLVFTEEELQSRSKFLASQFQGSEAEMHHFLSYNQRLVTMGREKFHKMTELLAQHGISKKELLIYPNIYRRKYETVACRIRQLEEGKVQPVTLRMINTTYKKYQAKYGRLILDAEVAEIYKSTLDLLSCELGFTKEEAKNIIEESLWLNNTKLSTLKEKIELLWSYGVPSEAIRDRIWVLAFPTSTIRSRIESMKQSGLTYQDFPKSFLIAIKSSEDKFIKFQERLLMDKAILDQSACKDKPGYICSRLSCSAKELELVCKKFPALLSVRLPKLKTNLDILLQEFGVSPSIIKEWPRVLALSTETLQSRLEQLHEHGVSISGKVLYLTNQEYERFISNLSTPI